MKYFIDGDQLVITKNDFVDLQSSEALFIPLASICEWAAKDAPAIAAFLREGQASCGWSQPAFYGRPSRTREPDMLPCDNCELADGCIVQPFTEECMSYRREHGVGIEQAPAPPMCKSQLAQIDCRVEHCRFYAGGGQCSNVSPAITLNDGTYVCWSSAPRQSAPAYVCAHCGSPAAVPEGRFGPLDNGTTFATFACNRCGKSTMVIRCTGRTSMLRLIQAADQLVGKAKLVHCTN